VTLWQQTGPGEKPAEVDPKIARLAQIAGGALSSPDRLILESATGARSLSEDELRLVLSHVAQAGFDPIIYRRRSAAEHHYQKHVVRQQEWPSETTLDDYLRSVRKVILDARSGLFTSRYQRAYQLGVIRPSSALRGPRGFDYVLVEYRLDLGRWVTAHQVARGLAEIQSPQRTELRWLRQPG
jgi:hypothetical protein